MFLYVSKQMTLLVSELIDTLCGAGLALGINDNGNQNDCSGYDLLIVGGDLQQNHGVADNRYDNGTQDCAKHSTFTTHDGSPAQNGCRNGFHLIGLTGCCLGSTQTRYVDDARNRHHDAGENIRFALVPACLDAG